MNAKKWLSQDSRVEQGWEGGQKLDVWGKKLDVGARLLL